MKICGHAAKRDNASKFCHSCYMVDYRKRKPEVVARNKQSKEKRYAYTVKKNYGLSQEAFDQLVLQFPVCGICTTTADLVIDHDHETGKVRGRLCRTCNLSLGGLGDTEADVLRALDYLRKGVK